jgi:hypothetical protein
MLLLLLLDEEVGIVKLTNVSGDLLLLLLLDADADADGV